MATQEEFNAFYEIHLKPKLVEFEKQRQNIVNKLKTVLFSLIVFSLIVLLLLVVVAIVMGDSLTEEVLTEILTEEVLYWGITAIIVGVVILVIWTIRFYRRTISPYKLNFKKEIVGRLVTLVDENLAYDPEKKIPLWEFRTSQLFDRDTIDRWTGEDYVEGTINKIRVKFSEVEAEEYHYDYDDYGYDDNGSGGYYETIFEGLFFVFNFNLSFQGVTLVLPDVAERYFGGFGKWLQSVGSKITSKKLVHLDDPEVEREFVVYSDNPIMARYVLSPRFMRRFLAFRRRLQKQVFLSFVDGRLYMAIFVNKDLFEPPVFKTVLNFELISEFFEYMRLGEEIVEDLAIYLNNPRDMEKNNIPPLIS
ncbi:MAG: hypothetical protein DRR19_02845 [Candidatus Parabeggiatoa sp. nov. 1]|nr:MAG: hypothetical protein DRR19_02845 [Gammaproteobacteria bacterium]